MASLTEYEHRREARIARNREILLQLVGNLPAHRALMEEAGGDASIDATGGGGKKRSRGAKSVPSSSEVEVRRSGRIRNQPAPIYTSFEVDEDLGDRHARAKRRAEKTKTKTAAASKGTSKGTSKGSSTTAPAKPPAPPAENSIKTLDARMRACAEKHLGTPIRPADGTGAMKAAVVHELSPIGNPRFSKYSGIQEWANCVCLFVNVGDKHGNSYDNVFTHAGGRISWFAQPRQHEETPVIAKIIGTGDAELDDLADATAPEALSLDAAVAAAEGAVAAAEAAVAAAEAAALAEKSGKKKSGEKKSGGNAEESATAAAAAAAAASKKGAKTSFSNGGKSDDDPVWPLHLFCRMEGCEYVYCGRLRCMEHDPDEVPMKFLFRLLDAPLLRTSDDFLGLVDLADADASLGSHMEKAKKAKV